MLPLCDEFIVAVGNGEDNTLDLILAINSPKIRIIHTIWDDTLREGGRVLAVETDKAFQAVSPDVDWCFYIQADEVVHEKYYDTIRKAMAKYKDDMAVNGLLFHYTHFYGSYDYVGESWNWYRREIRIVRNKKSIFSYRDAQGFRKEPNEKLNVKLIDAYIYHYGWVRDPRAMQHKQRAFSSLYPHPSVMAKRISEKNWKFDFDVSKKNYSPKERIKRLVGFRIGEYKNYKIV